MNMKRYIAFLEYMNCCVACTSYTDVLLSDPEANVQKTIMELFIVLGISNTFCLQFSFFHFQMSYAVYTAPSSFH